MEEQKKFFSIMAFWLHRQVSEHTGGETLTCETLQTSSSFLKSRWATEWLQLPPSPD